MLFTLALEHTLNISLWLFLDNTKGWLLAESGLFCRLFAAIVSIGREYRRIIAAAVNFSLRGPVLYTENPKKEEKMMYYDNTLLMLINGFAGQWVWLDKAMILIAKYGPLLFGLYLIGLWFSGDSNKDIEQNRRRALSALFAALLALGVNQLIGGLWFRDRPYVHNPVHRLLPASPDPSFPSDHAAGAFSIAGAVACGRSLGGALLTVLAAILAVSRVYVGLHYPSDILGGMAIGLLSSWLVERNIALLDKPAAWLLTAWNVIEAKLPLLSHGH